MLHRVYNKFIQLTCIILVGYLFFQGLFTLCNIQNVFENTFYVENNVFTQLTGILFFVLFVILLIKLGGQILEKQGKIIFLILLCLMDLFLIWWVTQTVFWFYGDIGILYGAAAHLLEGDFSYWQPGGYCYMWPFQTTLTLMIAAILKTSSLGASFYIFPFICILFYTITILSIYATLQLMFEDKALVNAQGIMLACYFPYAFLSLCMYGDPIGYGWGTLAIFHAVKYVKRSKSRNLLLSGMFMALAIVFKLNCSILLVGVVVLLILKAVLEREKLPRRFLLIMVFLLIVFGGKKLPDLCFEAISGMDMPVGNSRWTHLAMGLQECEKAPGWYNGYNANVFIDNGYDTEKAAEEAKKAIKALVGNFRRHPDYAWKFFHKKLASEWNNPTFQCFHEQSSRRTARELSSFVKSFLYEGGKLNILAIGFLDIAQSVLLFGILLYFILEKNADYCQLFWGLLFIGAFVFWMFWEAKARYVAPYFLFLIPYSFMGYRMLVQCWKEKRVKRTVFVLLAVTVFLYFSNVGWINSSLKINRDTESYYEHIHRWNQNFLWLRY